MEMPLKMKTTVPSKRRDKSPTPSGDILEDIVDVIFPFNLTNIPIF
jgi:hypothetical protein